MTRRSLFAIGAMFVSTLAMTGAAQAEMLVVRSLGSSARTYPPGRSLPDSASITLRAGDAVTLLGPRGTRTFRGPGTFRIGAAAQAGGIAGAIGAPRSRSRIGAVRGTVAPRPSWPADIARGGPVCTAGNWDLSLWRADASAPARLTIAWGDSGQAEVDWPRGASTLAWPATVPVRAGGDYRLTLDGADTAVPVRIVAVDGAPADRQQTAAALIREGCVAQLDRLLANAPRE